MSLPALIVDDEFQRLIPPLTDDEFCQLEKNIISEGVREPIVVWAGENIIVDGHNRYRICQRLNIPFGVFEKKFADRKEAIEWMYDNQTGRRNLSPGQKAALELDVSEAILREEAKIAKENAGKQYHRGAGKQGDERGKGLHQLVQTFPEEPQSLPPEHRETSPGEERAAKAEFGIEKTRERDGGDTSDGRGNTTCEHMDTAKRIARKAGVGEGTVQRVMAVKNSGDNELYDRVRSGEVSANKAYQEVQRRRRELVAADIEQGQAIVYAKSGVGECHVCDVRITEPKDVHPSEWLYNALSGVRHSGFAYVFVDPSPDNLIEYLSASIPMNVELAQVLVWSFDYVVGNNDRTRYKPSWKAVLFYRGTEARELRFPYIKERNAVQCVNAEGGELGKPGYDLRMPMELAERIIKQSTRDGDMVFDPFSRNGTFLLAAKKLGRDAIGYEDDPSLVDNAVSRGVDRG